MNTYLSCKWICKKCDAKADDWMDYSDAMKEGRRHYQKVHKIKRNPYVQMLLLPPIYRDENTLVRLYWGQNMTCQEIADVFKVNRITIVRWMKRFEIPIRTESDCAKLSMRKFAMEQKLKRWSGVEDALNYQRKKNLLKLACGEEL